MSSTVKGVGASQVYQGVQLSIDKQSSTIVRVPFECHRCGQNVDSERGYFIEHYRVKTDRYGAPRRVLCAASNNKVRADLRTLDLTGECDQCGTVNELHFEEEYPGGLSKYGGFMTVPCAVCDGKTHATCDSTGCPDTNLTEIETEDTQLGIAIKTKHWVHTTSGKAECGNDGLQYFVVDTQQTDPSGAYVKIAGPYANQQDAVDAEDALLNAPTASGNEMYEVTNEVVAGTTASAFVLSVKTNPVNMITVSDGFEIAEYDDNSNPASPFDLSDPITAALMGNTTAQEG